MSDFLEELIKFALTFGVVLLVLIIAGAITFYSLRKRSEDKPAERDDPKD